MRSIASLQHPIISFIIAGTILAFSVGVVSPIMTSALWLRRPEGLGTLGWIFLFANIGLAILPWLTRLPKRIDFFEPILFVSLIFFLMFVLRPLQILRRPELAAPFLNNNQALFDKTLLYSFLAIASFYIGYANPLGKKIGRNFPIPNRLRQPWRYRRVMFISIIYMIVGSIGVALAVTRAGGIGVFWGNLQGRQILAQASQSSFASLSVLTSIATLLLFTYSFKRSLLKIWALFGLILTTILILPFGGRTAVLTTPLAIVVIYYYTRSQFHFKRLRSALMLLAIATFVVVFIVVFGALRAYSARQGNLAGATSALDSRLSDPFDSFVREYVQYDWFAIVVDVFPSQLSYLGGDSFVETFTLFVPRALWPAKPSPIAFQVNKFVGGPGTGTPASLPGELYLNFGLPGVIIGMVLFGLILKALYSLLRAHITNPSIILLYAYHSPICIVFLRVVSPQKCLGLYFSCYRH